MVLKGLNVATKHLSVLILSLFMLSCSGSKPKPYLLSEAKTNLCQNELEATISELINAKNFHLSKDAFSQKSSLYLTNQKRRVLGQSTITNDLNGRKKLMLYRENKFIYIGLMKEENLLKSKRLFSCP